MRGEQRKIRDSYPKKRPPPPRASWGSFTRGFSLSLSPPAPSLSTHTHARPGRHPARPLPLPRPPLLLPRPRAGPPPAPPGPPPVDDDRPRGRIVRPLLALLLPAAQADRHGRPAAGPVWGQGEGSRTENGEERKGDSGRGWGPKGAEGKRKTPAPLSVSRSDVSLRARRPPPTHTPSAAAPPLRARRPLRLPTSHHPHAFNLTTLTTPLSRSPPPPLASPAPPASAPPTRPRPARRSRPLRAAASGAWSSPSSASPA